MPLIPERCGRCHWAAVLLLGVLLASPAVWRMLPRVDTSVDLSHELWMARHDLTYNDDAEKKRRREIFRRNVEYVESFNRRGDSEYTLGVNHFADRTEEEIKSSSFGLLPFLDLPTNAEPFTYSNVTHVSLPPSKDWRNEGAVTRVKNQLSCGSCWAFAAVAATEGITKIKKGTLMSLSEQELVDCETTSHGCNGGYPTSAFQYIKSRGIATGDEYWYTGRQGTCRAASTARAAYINGYSAVTSYNERALQAAVANQPVVIVLDAGSRDFLHYRSGVFTGSCGTQLNHAVTFVGYGTTNTGVKYWIMKNSWGTGWGESGYMRILRESGSSAGLCGLASYPSYPTA